MPGLLSHYREFFKLPGVRRLLVTALVARMPVGMMSLALLMHLRELSGSFAFGGGIVGTYFVAMAASAPIQGRLADRYGPRGILLATGIVQPVALGLLLFAAPLHLSLTAVAPLAAIAGAFMPPISVLTRTLWRHRFERAEDRRTAFAVDSVLIEINFTIGPALVGMALLFGTPALAFGITWVVAASAAPLFVLSGAQRYWKSSAHEVHHLLGPLTEPRLLIAYATSTALTFSFGMLEVGYPGFAARAGMPALGGALLAICSVGSALGGVAYGGMHFALPLERQLPRLLLLMAVPFGAHAFAASAWVLAPLAFVAGLMIAPALTALSLLVTQYAPARYATEAFTWMSTCILIGVGAGMAVGGQLIEAVGPWGAFASAAAGGVVAALVSLPLQRS
ncbi:MAG TPA: MFS transporter [Casimicrobiaceae bacterium]|jgi:MFS family permease|nr:MFS transporter [Casimicrobiaceae bacterium]